MKRKTNTMMIIRRTVAVALMLVVFMSMFAVAYSLIGNNGSTIPAEGGSRSALMPGTYANEQIDRSKRRQVIHRSLVGGALRTAAGR